MTAALAVVCVACAATIGIFLAHDVTGSAGDRVSTLFDVGTSPQKQAQDDQSERDTVMSVASQFVQRLNTYGPHDLDSQNKMPGYQERVESLMSAKFAAEFEKQQAIVLAERSVAGTGYARVARIFSYGVQSMDSDSAVVLVAGDFTSSYPSPQAPKDASKRISYSPTGFRYAVSLVKISGRWKVDLLSAVADTAAGESFGSGTAPSTTPSSTASNHSTPSNRSTTPAAPKTGNPTSAALRSGSQKSGSQKSGNQKSPRAGSRG